MRKVPKILLCIVAALMIVLGFLLFRSCNQDSQPSASPSAPSVSNVSAAVTPSASLESSTPEASPWEDEMPMMVGGRGTTVGAVQDRLRALGYFRYKASGYFVSMTQQSILSFQKKNSLMQDGLIGEETLQALYSAGVQRNAIVEVKTPEEKPSTVRPREYGETTPWSEISPMSAANHQFLILDFSSQLYFNAVRVGGTNHLEFEPANAEEGQKLLKIFGGQTSYEKRACIVQVGDRYFAASFCGMPHGTATVADNTLGGQFCLYFTGSTAEGLPIQDAEHNANIVKASTPAQE